MKGSLSSPLSSSLCVLPLSWVLKVTFCFLLFPACLILLLPCSKPFLPWLPIVVGFSPELDDPTWLLWAPLPPLLAHAVANLLPTCSLHPLQFPPRAAFSRLFPLANSTEPCLSPDALISGEHPLTPPPSLLAPPPHFIWAWGLTFLLCHPYHNSN